MSHVVIDIETVKQETIPHWLSEYFLNRKWNKIEDVEKRNEVMLTDVACHPALAKVILIVLKSGDSMVKYSIWEYGSEKKLLQEFWGLIPILHRENRYLTYVTFNGINFDFPFLRVRSSILGIKHYNLPENRWRMDEHFDVRLWLASQYGVGTLEFWAKLHGIEVNEEYAEDSIYDWWEQKQYDMIEKHCEQDVTITEQLYLRCKPSRITLR